MNSPPMFILKGTESPTPSEREAPQQTDAGEVAIAQKLAYPQFEIRRGASEVLRDVFLGFAPLFMGICAGVALGAFFLSGP